MTGPIVEVTARDVQEPDAAVRQADVQGQGCGMSRAVLLLPMGPVEEVVPWKAHARRQDDSTAANGWRAAALDHQHTQRLSSILLVRAPSSSTVQSNWRSTSSWRCCIGSRTCTTSEEPRRVVSESVARMLGTVHSLGNRWRL